MSKKVAVSACLLGRKCRYDGSDRFDEELQAKLQGCEVIPFCPEEAVLGTPRETIDIVDGKVIGNQSEHDYTEAIVKEAKKFIAKHPRIDVVYSKSKSPSCALCSARVFNRSGELVTQEGMGVFLKELRKAYKDAIFEERR